MKPFVLQAPRQAIGGRREEVHGERETHPHHGVQRRGVEDGRGEARLHEVVHLAWLLGLEGGSLWQAAEAARSP